MLSRAPETISVKEIIEAAEGTTAPVACSGENCPRLHDCLTAPLWNELDKLIGNYLENVSLKDVIDGKINRVI